MYWSRADGDYSPAALREVFAAVGAVEDVLVRDSKKKKKGSAIVVMADREGARAAAASALGERANPLLVVPHSKSAPGVPAEGEEQDGTSQPAAPPTMPSRPLFPQSAAPPGAPPTSKPPPPVGQANSDYESVTLMKMRQAAERARIIREMEQAEEAEGS